MLPDVIFRVSRPIGRDFRAFQRATRRRFGLGDRILQHRLLAGPEAWWETRVTICLGIISYPKVDATMGRKKHRIACDKVIVKPARRCADCHSSQESSCARKDLALLIVYLCPVCPFDE